MECTTRETTEKRIALGLEDIWADYIKYNPDGRYLSLTIMRAGEKLYMQANNSYWPDGADNDMPLEFEKEAM